MDRNLSGKLIHDLTVQNTSFYLLKTEREQLFMFSLQFQIRKVSWKISKINLLWVFVNSIFNVSSSDIISNQKLWNKTNLTPIEKQIKETK